MSAAPARAARALAARIEASTPASRDRTVDALRALVWSEATVETSIPGLPNTAMSVTGRCGAASPQTTDP